MKKATFIVSLIEGILNIGAAIFAVIYGFVFIVVYGIGEGIGKATSGDAATTDPTAMILGYSFLAAAALFVLGAVFSSVIAGICRKTPTKKGALRTLGILNILCLTPFSGILSIVCSAKE